MEEEDYEIDSGTECPKCGHSPIHSRTCTNWCEDGYFDVYDDDPIYSPIPGIEFIKCDECKGTGVEVWCPNCGTNLSEMKLNDEEKQDLYE